MPLNSVFASVCLLGVFSVYLFNVSKFLLNLCFWNVCREQVQDELIRPELVGFELVLAHKLRAMDSYVTGLNLWKFHCP